MSGFGGIALHGDAKLCRRFVGCSRRGREDDRSVVVLAKVGLVGYFWVQDLYHWKVRDISLYFHPYT